jgi:hypothetical protein
VTLRARWVECRYTCEPVGNLHGHGLRVRSLRWSADDMYLHSCGLDGAVYTWSIQKLCRIREVMQKGCQYSCVTAVGDEKDGRVFAVGDDCKIKEFSALELAVSKELDAGVEVSSARCVAVLRDCGAEIRLPLSKPRRKRRRRSTHRAHG